MQNATGTIAQRDRTITLWLWILFGSVFAMVLVGGITRLTGSGLSMVDWRPVMGVLPPIGEAAWIETFDAYSTSPEYREINSWMDLDDFKRIFFWEYLHRLLGRLIALIAFVPWLVLTLQKKIEGWLSWRVIVSILLGGAQGLLGWYMVKSGLVDVPQVSHLRLAAHSGLAFLISQWILWMLLDLHFGRARPSFAGAQKWTSSVLALLAVQILYGALMAGTHAGLLFPTFPDMNGRYLPGPFFPLDSLASNLFYSPLAIHWIHRVVGFALLCLAAGTLFALRRIPLVPAWARGQLVAVLVVQFALGAFTAVYQTPLWLAITHQAGAFLAACSASLLAHRTAAAARPPSTS
ncbi:MAG: COX15/CtaA family protein [Myxococcota bacterium]|nr:COX15/CtaA family protein [Myxococcota bacterium]